jgi:hypothetical protein
MSGDIDNIILEHLRLIRSDMADFRNDLRDMKARFSSMESYISTLHGDQARSGIRIDNLEERINRLEKRTGLLDA